MDHYSTAVAQTPKFSVAISTKGYQKLINDTIRDPNRARRFIASITSAVAVNPALQECEPGSILAGALLGESLNLSPSPQLGQFYLVPFKDKKSGTTKAQFIPGYKGYVQLALRSGQYADLDVTEIKQGEYLGKDSFTGKPRFKFVEDYDTREALPTVGYMAYFEYLNGFKKVLYWTKEKVMSHADQYSKAFSRAAYEKYAAGEVPPSEMWKYSSFWYKDFDEMAKKTVLKQLISKWGITSVEMVTAFESDSAVAAIDNTTGEIITDAQEEIPAQPTFTEELPDNPAPVQIPAESPELLDLNAL